MATRQGEAPGPPAASGDAVTVSGDAATAAGAIASTATETGARHATAPPAGWAAAPRTDRSLDPSLDPICPYLLADEGGWRASRPMPEHRCMAQHPAAVVEQIRQRRLCLVATHVDCPYYEAATDERQAAMNVAGLRAERVAARRHVALTRATPTALERPSAVPGPTPATGLGRRTIEVALVILMLAAAGVLFAARFSGYGLAGAGAGTASPTGTAALGSTGASTTSGASSSPPAPLASGAGAASRGAAGGTPTPTSHPAPTPTPTPVPTLSRPPTASVSPTQQATRSYRAKSGDTLSGIAAAFGTTVATLERLNGITDPRSLRIGQVLIIP